MTIMTVFKLCFNIVLNCVFQDEKQVCLDSCIFLYRFGGIHYFLVFRTCFTLVLSMVKKRVFRFLSMFVMFFIFRRTLFVCFLCRFVCFVWVGGWGNGASVCVFVCVDRLAGCGSSWETFMRWLCTLGAGVCRIFLFCSHRRLCFSNFLCVLLLIGLSNILWCRGWCCDRRL